MFRSLMPVVAAVFLLIAAAAPAADELTDATFTTRAAAAGMAEVELGRLAEQKAENAAVKAFAKKLVIDHTVSNAELKKLADQEKIALPTAQEPQARAAADKLESLSGAAFDRAFMEQMVLDHGRAVQLFTDASKSSQVDGELKAYAEKTLPTLQHHMQEAQTLNQQLQGSASR